MLRKESYIMKKVTEIGDNEIIKCDKIRFTKGFKSSVEADNRLVSMMIMYLNSKGFLVYDSLRNVNWLNPHIIDIYRDAENNLFAPIHIKGKTVWWLQCDFGNYHIVNK